MASDFTLTTILIVVLGSVWCEQRPFLRYSNYLKKTLPYHWQYDQEKLGKSVDKITRWHQVEELRNDQYHGELRPHFSPLRPRPDSFQQWKKWAKQGILAAVVGNKDKELLKVRAQLLQEKLSPNHHVFKKTEVHPQEKPKFKAKEKRFKRHIRAAVINKLEDFEKEPLSGSILRPKRQVVINPQLQPETVMQPHIQIAIPPEPNDKQKNAFPDKRGKRQILYIINRPSQLLYRSPRTTPNPFIRETNIGDYDIGRQDLEGSLPDLGSSRLDSYPLIREEESEFSKIISHLTSVNKWQPIQAFSEKVFRYFFDPFKYDGVFKIALKSKDHNSNNQIKIVSNSETLDWLKIAPLESNYKQITHNRVKRKMDKTLQRKRAKKRKQKQRRVESKRLRMLTHARRIRKQKKAKQARLQRRYTRMNSTSLPDHFRNLTQMSEKEKSYEKNHDNTEADGSKKIQPEKLEDESSYSKKQENLQSDSQDEYYSETSEDNKEGAPDNGNDTDYEDYDDSEEENEPEISFQDKED